MAGGDGGMAPVLGDGSADGLISTTGFVVAAAAVGCGVAFAVGFGVTFGTIVVV